MSLSEQRYETLRHKIATAVQAETSQLDELRSAVSVLVPSNLQRRECRAVASIATDGGDNAVTFGPLNLEIIRVVDSLGRERVHEVIAMSEDDSAFRALAETLPILIHLMERLDVEFDDLCYPLGSRRAASSGRGSEPRARLRAFRDLLEWAVLLKIAYEPSPFDVLLLRDGLLRTKTIRREVFPKLAAAFRRACEEPAGTGRVYLLGVAKTSAVLSKLGVAMSLQGTFERSFPCWVEVPEELEARCYSNDWKWMDAKAAAAGEHTECFGRMHLVKLAASADAPVLPVDVPYWMDRGEAVETLGRLAHDAEGSFPVVGYPAALQAAHEQAKLTGMEMSVSGDLMVDALREPLADDEAERVTRLVHLGRALIVGGTSG